MLNTCKIHAFDISIFPKNSSIDITWIYSFCLSLKQMNWDFNSLCIRLQSECEVYQKQGNLCTRFSI